MSDGAASSGPGAGDVPAGAQVLLVTSSGAPPDAVVPVLAAAEALSLRVRAIDLGGAGGGGNALSDRVRRALLGEGAERRLRRELELNPPDVAVVFDPHAAQALTVARDEVANPAPVVAVVAELEPVAEWAQTDADRFLALDEVAAVALAEHGVEADRILVAGAFGEHVFWQAGRRDRAAVRDRFKLAGSVVLVEAAGMGAELTNQLALQLSLLDAHDRTTFLFDAAGDAEAAAVLRRSVPALGLRAKLFGATGDAAELWRAADVVIARPSPRTIARCMLLGAKLVALVDDSAPGLATAAAALEARKLAMPARGLLLLTSALEQALKHPAAQRGGEGGEDGAATCADVLAILAADKRAVIDERRAAAAAGTRDRIRAASAAAGAATKAAAAAGDLEDLSGGDAGGGLEDFDAGIDVAQLREEGKRRLGELEKAMMAARNAADAASAEATAQRGRGEPTAAAERRADAERARMHSLLAEMSTLQQELKELDRVAAAAPRPRPAAPGGGSASSSGGSTSSSGGGRPRQAASVDDLLADLKSKAGSAAPSSSSRPSSASSGASRPKPKDSSLDDELAALKRKMAEKKKP